MIPTQKAEQAIAIVKSIGTHDDIGREDIDAALDMVQDAIDEARLFSGRVERIVGRLDEKLEIIQNKIDTETDPEKKAGWEARYQFVLQQKQRAEAEAAE